MFFTDVYVGPKSFVSLTCDAYTWVRFNTKALIRLGSMMRHRADSTFGMNEADI